MFPQGLITTTTEMRRSNLALLAFALGGLCLLLTLGDALVRQRAATERLDSGRKLVAELGLTDLALFTEARYLRHLSQADLHSAFQDHPLALEHFPGGSLVPPPWQSAP